MKAYLKQHRALIAAAGIFLICVGAILFSRWLNEARFNNQVTTQRTEANTAVQESKVESGVAANYSIERRAEDAVRERVIKPKLEDARRRSANSKPQLETAQQQYENRKKNLSNLNSNVADNCDQLKRLYPNVTFEYCFDR